MATTSPDDFMTLAPEFGAYVAVQVFVFAACVRLTWRLWPQHKDPWLVADILFSILVFPLLTWVAIVSTLELRHDLNSRWHGQTNEGRCFIFLYSTRTILHIPVQALQENKWVHLLLMSLHHVLSLACFLPGIMTGRMHFFASFAGCCEVSTVFLNNISLFKELTVKGKTLKECIPDWIYVLNGVFLWLAFLVFRMALFPTWLYLFYTDVRDHPEATWHQIGALEKYLYPSVIFFLFMLSSYWTKSITMGMLKALRQMGNPGGEKEPASNNNKED